MSRYRLDELPEGKTDWARLENAANAHDVGAPDADNPEWTSQAFAEAEYVTPGGLRRVPVYIRMYQVVLDYYKSFGKGYQTRINDDLLALVRKRQGRASRIQPITGRRVVARGTGWEGRAKTPNAG
jgi:uncharacterized protein (DUF4415 family)